MKDEMFNELVKSVKEAIAIDKGEAKPSRLFEYSDNKDHGIPNLKIYNGKQKKNHR